MTGCCSFQLPSNLLQFIPILSVTLVQISIILSKVNLPILWTLGLPAYSGQITISHLFAFLGFPHISISSSLPFCQKKVSQLHILSWISKLYVSSLTITLLKEFFTLSVFTPLFSIQPLQSELSLHYSTKFKLNQFS